MDQKGKYLTQNDPKCQILAKFGRFWDKNRIVNGRKQNYWHPYVGEPNRPLFCVKKIDRRGSNAMTR